MLEHGLKLFLKITRKRYLVPFVEGLVNLGRPSAVLFPTELLEQGLSLVLSGLTNTLSTQTNLDWVWPYWLEQQQDPHSPAFIPTGVNLLTVNLTRRNWVSIGIPDSQRESMIDPVGMLTPFAFGWSIFPFIRYQDTNFLPPRMERDQVSQNRLQARLPIIQTHYHVHDDFAWYSEATSIKEDNEELVHFAHHLHNKREEAIHLTFGLAIRPYNALTIGHINRLKFKNQLWRVNRKPGVLFLDQPDRNYVSDRHLGDPVMLNWGEVPHSSGRSRSGILGGVSEFDVVLKPGESRELVSLATLGRTQPGPNLKFRHLNQKTITQARKRAHSHWEKVALQGTNIGLPDKAVEDAWYAVKNHMHVFDDIKHFSPGTFFYHTHWFRDSAFIALGFENVGFHDKVGKKFPTWLKQQTADGFFKSQNGEWDSAGQAIWTMVNHCRHVGSRRLLEQIYPAIRKGCRWIEEQCRKAGPVNVPHAGLLPPGFSAEHFGPNDHYFWDNFWGLVGIQSTLWAARRLGHEADASRFNQFYEEYRHRLTEAMLYASRRGQNGALPCSPYRNLDSAAIGNLIAVTPLDLFPVEASWFRETVTFLVGNNLIDGLFYQRIIHTGLNAYLSVQLARALLALGDASWYEILQALMRHGKPLFTWPEAIHPATGGGCMGDGDHGWAAAEFVSLVREALVTVQNETLVLGQGLVLAWLKPGQTIHIKDASTVHGKVSFEIDCCEEALTLTWEVSRNGFQDRVPLVFVLPQCCSDQHDVGRSQSNRIVLESERGMRSFPRVPSQSDRSRMSN